ncbi:MAG: hypoxanthine phosphoribosyltransferase [Thermodesulfobacteriota bacterium]
MKEEKLRLVLSQERIEERIKVLAREISKDYSGLDLLLVGVLNGVFMFLGELAKNLSIPAGVDFIRLASYGAGVDSAGRIEMTKDVESDLAGRHVLIVEDIADSGLTINWLREHLVCSGAASVKVCVLVNKLERRDLAVELNYVGFEVKEGFLVGYGLDYNGRYRCLPAIYHLNMS